MLARTNCLLFALAILPSALATAADDPPAGRWTQVAKDPAPARRGSALRFAPDANGFLLWGFMNADTELLQESPTMPVPEHDMAAFDPATGRWQNHLPKQWEAEWSKKLPPVWVPRAYSGITSGSERSLFRPPAGYPAEAARPDLNIVFDQVAYHPPTKSLVYFTGGLTVAYDVVNRKWTDLKPAHSPPPVLGGALAYDPVNDEMVLSGGGNIVDTAPDGRIVGFTGTWAYSFKDKDWRRLKTDLQPPPRMNTRLVTDAKNQVLVLFGGDGHSHYLADTWLFDLKTRQWRQSKAPGGPPPRAGHFTVYDPQTGLVIIGGGYQHKDLADMWAYDPAKDRWGRLAGEVPAGMYLSADLWPEKRLIVLATSTKAPGDGHGCNVLYPVRTTYTYSLGKDFAFLPDEPVAHPPLAKRSAEESGRLDKPDPLRQKVQAERLAKLPANLWVLLADPGRVAPTRTWGSATFDTDRGRILIWGGGHCGYGGSDVDAYDPALHTWISGPDTPDYPHRLWDLGVRLAGVSFHGQPWNEHGRKIFAYDPVSKKMIAARPIRCMTGHQPDALMAFPGEPRAYSGAKVDPPTTYYKYATWSWDPDSGRWDVVGPAPVGVDALVTTRHGVMGVPVDWPARLNDAGYNLPWKPDDPAVDNALYQFDPAKKTWLRLGDKQPSPQNLYEMTSLAYDTKRDQVLLHGGGQDRDELWSFDLKTKKWLNLKPKVNGGAAPPTCNREMVYLPDQDVVLSYGPAKGGPALWAYKPADSTWQRIAVDPPPGVDPRAAGGQNRALVYDPKRDLVLLVLGAGGDLGKSRVYAMRYRHSQAKPGP